MGDPNDTLGDDRRALEAEVLALGQAWAAGNPDDPALRGACARRLHRLRARWREAPLLFGPELVTRLRSLAEALARPPGPEAGRRILREVFGHAAFRPGQEPSSRRCWPGATASASCPPAPASRSPTRSRPGCWAAPRWWYRRSSRS
ncbi:MAG: hypothetical protein QM767_09270 [Anaeromyxobacter sp.]